MSESSRCENVSLSSLHSNSPSVVYLNEAIDATEKSVGENDEKSFNLREIFKNDEPSGNVNDQLVSFSKNDGSIDSLKSNSPSTMFLYKALDCSEKSMENTEIIENAENVKKSISVENSALEVSNINVVIVNERDGQSVGKKVERLEDLAVVSANKPKICEIEKSFEVDQIKPK